jgi:hypothetical protein
VCVWSGKNRSITYACASEEAIGGASSGIDFAGKIGWFETSILLKKSLLCWKFGWAEREAVCECTKQAVQEQV